MKFGAALVLLVSLGAAADVVQVKERTYLVRYKDEAVERYVVKWTAHLDASVRNQGGAFIPYQGNVETPRCSWTITTKIDRTVAMATRLGQPITLDKMNRTLNDPQGKGGAVVVDKSCDEARAQRESEIGNARSAFLAAFDRLTNADMETIKKEAQATADVVTITVQ
jgi:hypothetical protein